MKPFILFLITSILSAQPLFAAPPLTLDEALEMAIRSHPQVIEAKENLRGAEARTGLALASYYPQIYFAADWNKGRTYIAAQENIKTTEVNTAALYLKQTIFDFGRTSGVVDAAHSNREAADQALAITQQDVALRVKSAFYLLLAAEKQVISVAETVKSRAEVLRQAEEFFNQGIRARVDVAKAEANFFTAKTALIRAENNSEIARLELANAIGIATLAERSPVEPSAITVPLPERNLLLQEAVHNRAELQQLAALKSSASANLKTAKGSYLPVLSGTANIGYADRDLPPTGNVWGVGLNLTMPLFTGFSSVEQVRETTTAINAIEARQSYLKLQIGKEVENAWLSASEASARITSTDKEVAAASESMALAEGRYLEGVGNIIEVTDSQTQALEARTAHIQARYDYYTALARLDRAVGKHEK